MIRLCLAVLLVGAALAAPVAQPLGGPRASEPPAEARFHDGARLFAEGDVEGAAAVVDAALAEAPSDARLRALRELIRQQQPDGGGGEPPPDDDDGAGEPGETPPRDGAAPPDGDGPGPPPDPGSDDGRDPGDGEPPAPTDAGRGPMSRAEADALLDAVGGDERLLLRQQRRSTGTAERPERDW